MTDSQSSSEKRNFTHRLKEARIGDPAAQYDVALMYATGAGVGKSVSQAFAWTKAAAEKGHFAAQYLLGSAYAGGVGTPKDERRGVLWCAKAYEQGNEKAALRLAKVLSIAQPALSFQFAIESAEKGVVDAQVTVADCYAQALGVERDRDLAFVWYQRASQHGMPVAQFALGQAYEHGWGVEEDIALASQWYREAAGQGHPAARLALDRLDVAGRGRANRSAKVRAGSRERRTDDSRWTKYASHGRVDDFFQLGKMFEQGIGVEENMKQAKVWYKKAAELGHADAQHAFANSLDSSEPSQAVSWYRKAAVQGHAEAQVALANMGLQGLGIARDPLSALGWYAKAAEQGNAAAQFAMAKLLADGAQSLAFAAVTLAAEGGQAQAQCVMGDRYARGGGVAQNWFEAFRWYQMAADQDDAPAQCALASCYAAGNGVKKNLVQAFSWFEKAAAQNLPQAQWNLSELYATGLPGVEPDPKKATALCKRAANAGFAPASATLGVLCARGKKHERAVQWWTLAAEQGDLESLFNLGQAHRLGLGVAKDETRAFELLLQAAQGGVAPAQSRIGLCYATGEGAALDPIEACKWFALAALRGDKAAASNGARSRKNLSQAQQSEADRRAKVWTASHGNKT